MPFFQILGYDVFNPLEFCPEYTADVDIKRGEKADYAIMDEDGEPVILIEAKWCGENLDKHGSQLFRYFSTTTAKFGILTNGIIYRFYTDLDKANKMDEMPFLEINLLDLKENVIPELKKFTKSAFNTDAIMTSASELKYNSLIREFFEEQLDEPDDSFVSCVLSYFYEGRKTQNVLDDFRGIVKKSFVQFINDRINERLKTALDSEQSTQNNETDDDTETETDDDTDNTPRIVTTDEELEGYFIVKTLLHDKLGEHEISYKDTTRYFGILLDGKVNRWICRLYFGDRRKKLVLPTDESFELQTIDDLYDYRDEIGEALEVYTSEV